MTSTFTFLKIFNFQSFHSHLDLLFIHGYNHNVRRNTVSTKLSRILYLSTILLNGYGGCTLGVAFVIYSGFLRYLDRVCTVCHLGMYLGWPVLPGIQDTQTGGYTCVLYAIPGCTWDGLDSIVRQTWDFVDMSRFPFQYITFCYFYLFWCIFFVDYLEVFLMSVFSWRSWHTVPPPKSDSSQQCPKHTQEGLQRM